MSKFLWRAATVHNDYCCDRCGARVADKHGKEDKKAVVESDNAYYCRRCLNIVARRATQ